MGQRGKGSLGAARIAIDNHSAQKDRNPNDCHAPPRSFWPMNVGCFPLNGEANWALRTANSQTPCRRGKAGSTIYRTFQTYIRWSCFKSQLPALVQGAPCCQSPGQAVCPLLYPDIALRYVTPTDMCTMWDCHVLACVSCLVLSKLRNTTGGSAG